MTTEINNNTSALCHLCKHFFALLIVVLICFSSLSVLAQSIELDTLSVEGHGNLLQVRFGLHLEDFELVERDLKEGVVGGLQGKIRVQKNRSMWLDDTVFEKYFGCRVRYDSLAKEFLLVREEEKRVYRGKELKIVIAAAYSDVTMEFMMDEALERHQQYSLDFDVKFKQLEVPSWLRTTLFFLSWEMIPEKSYRLEFQY